jgi:ABC-type transporter Mla maintaining outer membrane lipid asymmetry permease subunit MlaE
LKLLPAYPKTVGLPCHSLAEMRATEQIDAIEALSVDSFKLLVVPRVAACVLVLPLLTTFMDSCGVFSGFLSEHFYPISLFSST